MYIIIDSSQSFYPADLEIIQIDEKDETDLIHMHSRSKSSVCHMCGALLNKNHSSHHRTVQDLPILLKRKILDMQIFDYECCTDICVSFSATETFDGFLSYNSRMIDRLILSSCYYILKYPSHTEVQ